MVSQSPVGFAMNQPTEAIDWKQAVVLPPIRSTVRRSLCALPIACRVDSLP